MDWLTIGLAFMEGLALIVSPCILPILPVVLSTGLGGGLMRPYGLILGFVVSFSAFTLLSRSLVKSVGLDTELLRQASFIILVVFGLIMLSEKLSDRFGDLTQGVANMGRKFSAQGGKPGHDGFLSGVAMGLAIGLIWTPCAGPLLAAVIIQTIRQESNLESVLTVLAFSMGAGFPMLILTTQGNRLMHRLDFFKRNSRVIRKALGAIIIATVLVTAFGGSLTQGWSADGAGKPDKTASVPKNKLIHPLLIPYEAPPLEGISAWINTSPLKMSELRGKVVLIDFWTYSCINCVRTLPYITRWDQKYRDEGLVIIGVHAPEFEFEKDLRNVQKAVAQHGIRYPVALDNNFDTWTNYENRYWPAHYLIDKQGRVVYTHFGEGQYAATEHNIRILLGLGEFSGKDRPGKESSAVSKGQSPETYLGYARAKNLDSPEQVRRDQLGRYSFPAQLPRHHWALKGPWFVGSEKIIAQEAGAALRYHFAARNVYLVLGAPPGETIPVRILLNGKPVKTLSVSNQTLYTLLDLPRFSEGVLELQAGAPGLSAYAFTFGS